ncbi:MAG TPA: tetratricopeptide repeat protein [Gammaproteobacteria bacterium]|nr:tetratricopeptide repeat protein [Gammaproteobacteria bacterium]
MAGRASPFAALALLLCAAVDAEAAYGIDYSADRPEELRACDASYFRGERAESGRCYSALLAGDADIRIKAEAAWALGNIVAANNYFQEAFDANPEDARLRLRWGKLFEATNAEAQEVATLYREALEIDPAYAPAILGMAELAAGRFEGRAREWVEEALEIEPESIGAHLLLASMELEVGNLELAEESLDRAFELVESSDYPPLEVYALRASLDLLRGDFESQWITRALEYSPMYGDAYAIPAYFFVITRRYREAIDFYERAVDVQPDLYAAHTALGVNLLRENRVDEAYRHLRTAYEGEDGYSSDTTVNTLNLIDSFVNFTVETYDGQTDPAGGGAGVILRLHQDETDVLTPYVLDLVNESIDTFSERYGFTLEEPVIAELYPVAADFSVRTAGLPGIGLLGVAFGYLVAMNSPSQAGSGQFHWGTTLWHEVAHVFTLEATDHLVPRWFSEGVSVHEEWSTGPLPGRHIPVHVLQAMADDRFLPISDLDEGFIRPTYENQVIVSYMQAGLICEYIAMAFGQRALHGMLERFRAGDETPAAIEAALGITPAEFDDRFALHVAAEFDMVLDNLEAWNEARAALREHAAAGDWEGVRNSAAEAIALMPGYVDEGSPYLALERAQRELGDQGAARETLERYWRLGGYEPTALMRLARALIDAGNNETAIEVLEALVLVTPLDESVHADLGDLLLETRPADALTEFTVLAALEPHDQASVNLRLAKAHMALGDTGKATEHLLYALEIAPHYREAQQLLLEIVR